MKKWRFLEDLMRTFRRFLGGFNAGERDFDGLKFAENMVFWKMAGYARKALFSMIFLVF